MAHLSWLLWTEEEVKGWDHSDMYDFANSLLEVDGVVDLTWQACHTYNVESYRIGKFVEKNFHLPFLHIETDYSDSDTEQLRVRIEAFLEIMKG